MVFQLGGNVKFVVCNQQNNNASWYEDSDEHFITLAN